MWKTLTKHGNWVPQTRFSLSRYHPSFYSPVGGGARLYREAKPKIFLNLVEVTQLKSAVTFLWYSIIGGKRKKANPLQLSPWADPPLPEDLSCFPPSDGQVTHVSQNELDDGQQPDRRIPSCPCPALWALGANPNTSFVWWECEVVIRKQTQVWHKALPPGRWAALSALHSNSSSISQNPRVASLTHQWF